MNIVQLRFSSGVQHVTMQVKNQFSQCYTWPHCLDSFVRMIGIKVISSLKAPSVSPTFGIHSLIPLEATLLIFLITGH